MIWFQLATSVGCFAALVFNVACGRGAMAARRRFDQAREELTSGGIALPAEDLFATAKSAKTAEWVAALRAHGGPWGVRP